MANYSDVDDVKVFLRKRLSKKRYIHSVNVAEESAKLARFYGEADADKAYFAGLLHDVCKEIPTEEQKEMVVKSQFSVERTELMSRPLWHAIAGAAFVRDILEVDDVDILNAIRYHTIGRAGMTRLEEIVYLADLISADRTYKDVNRMRRSAYTDIESAMLEALCFSIDSVVKKCGYFPHYTAEAYNQYVYICSRRENDKEKNNGEY